jgi:hypothetical protein
VVFGPVLAHLEEFGFAFGDFFVGAAWHDHGFVVLCVIGVELLHGFVILAFDAKFIKTIGDGLGGAHRMGYSLGDWWLLWASGRCGGFLQAVVGAKVVGANGVFRLC